ncbi:MAG: diphosphomevalonate decarboxylase [Saprospiraceae bacterium]
MNNLNVEKSVTWQCPSNLAIVKYWGKYGKQLPQNASISMTLKEAKTITTLSWESKKNNDQNIALSFLFDGEKNKAFESKLTKFLTSIAIDYFPFLMNYELTIISKNTFPHSSGIASSASSMGALALCLCTMEKNILRNNVSDVEFIQKASHIARLGSGSASRSVIGHWAMWGLHPNFSEANNEYAVDLTPSVHPIFNSLKNDILIVSAEKKSVSSTAGHQLMENNPYAMARYAQANQRIVQLYSALQTGDVESFGMIAEAEALTLHALMMCSEPSYMLMEPASLAIIKKIRSFRADTKLPVYFSLDAGPNIHLLYPENISLQVQTLIDQDLLSQCQNFQVIRDGIGVGPSIL